MFCFDNTFSTVSEKLIFFELILDNMDADEEPDDWKEYVIGTDMLDMKLEDIMVRMQPETSRYVVQKRCDLHGTNSRLLSLKLFSVCLFYSRCIYQTSPPSCLPLR